MATRIAPSRRASMTLPIEASMKLAWRKSRVFISISGGSVVCSSATAASIFSVSSIVLAPGCF